MAKKILIINKSFEPGGVQMALANMLEAIHNEYDVTLAVFNPNGPLRSRVPDNVKLLELSSLVQVLGMGRSDCQQFGTVRQKIFKAIGSIWARIFGNTLPVKFAMAFQKNVGEFDTVISYHQETGPKTLVTGFGYFALRKCGSPNKIAWIHADFLATNLATLKNLKTYQKFDKIVCVSRLCMDHFVASYPSLKEKCNYCYNYIPAEEIVQKASRMHGVFDKSEDTIVLFSACRLTQEKGLVPALETLFPLWRAGVNLKWYIAGEGPERPALETAIQANGVGDRVFLLGFQSNPYPYIREADYVFLPSLHETFSMVVHEAHILGTPVIASDIPIMREMFADGDCLCADGDFGKCIMKVSRKRSVGRREIGTPDNWVRQFERIIKNDTSSER